MSFALQIIDGQDADRRGTLPPYFYWCSDGQTAFREARTKRVADLVADDLGTPLADLIQQRHPQDLVLALGEASPAQWPIRSWHLDEMSAGHLLRQVHEGAADLLCGLIPLTNVSDWRRTCLRAACILLGWSRHAPGAEGKVLSALQVVARHNIEALERQQAQAGAREELLWLADSLRQSGQPILMALATQVILEDVVRTAAVPATAVMAPARPRSSL